MYLYISFKKRKKQIQRLVGDPREESVHCGTDQVVGEQVRGASGVCGGGGKDYPQIDN